MLRRSNKQAKLEEFRSFLDFTAMTFREKRRHKIDTYVTGRWVLTIKVDKDGQFKNSRLDGSVEVSRTLRSTTSRRTRQRPPGTDFVWHLSMPPRCTGICSIWI